MNFKIDIEIDWIDEESNLDETVKQEVIAKISNAIRSGMKEDIKKTCLERISGQVDGWIIDQLNSFCDRRIAVTDKWGDAVEHHESVTEMFKTKFDEMFNASVDKDGKELKACAYGNRTTRIDYMLNQKAEEYLKKIITNMDRDITNAINKTQAAQMAADIQKRVIAKLAEVEKKST